MNFRTVQHRTWCCRAIFVRNRITDEIDRQEQLLHYCGSARIKSTIRSPYDILVGSVHYHSHILYFNKYSTAVRYVTSQLSYCTEEEYVGHFGLAKNTRRPLFRRSSNKKESGSKKQLMQQRLQWEKIEGVMGPITPGLFFQCPADVQRPYPLPQGCSFSAPLMFREPLLVRSLIPHAPGLFFQCPVDVQRPYPLPQGCSFRLKRANRANFKNRANYPLWRN